MANKFNNKPQTLCFKCATPSPTCPWKYNFTPVEGWEAEETKLNISKTDDGVCRSYIVKSCPLFEENVRLKEHIVDIPGLKQKYYRCRGKRNVER